MTKDEVGRQILGAHAIIQVRTLSVILLRIPEVF